VKEIWAMRCLDDICSDDPHGLKTNTDMQVDLNNHWIFAKITLKVVHEE